MKTKFPILAILGGIGITLVTGLVPNTPPMLVGAEYYGYPLPWLIHLITAPEYFPWNVNIANLILDIIIWSIVVGLVVFISEKTRRVT